MRSTRTGGNMLNFEDMPKDLLTQMTELFNQECTKRGTKPQMQWIAGG